MLTNIIRPTFEEICSSWSVLTNDIICPDPLGKEIIKILWKDV
jgi:hypothetical protein